MTVRHGLTNSEWFEIEHLLPGNKSDPGVTAANNRLFVDAILYRYRTGVPWRDLPPHFGDFRVIHTRFMRWARNGIWENIFRVLSIDTDTEYAMIDSTINRAHQHSSGAKNSSKKSECIGKSKDGLSAKVHAICDALGNPIDFFLTPGEAHDLDGADTLIPCIINKIGKLLADKAYDAKIRVLDVLSANDLEAVIPPKSNRAETRDFDKKPTNPGH